MLPVSAEPARPSGIVIAAAGLLALLAAGTVLASSFTLEYPIPVLAAAWLIAFMGLLTTVLSAWRTSRATGARWSSAFGPTVKSAGRSYRSTCHDASLGGTPSETRWATILNASRIGTVSRSAYSSS